MTVRPPTLREKRRYILVRVEPAGVTVDQKELYYAVADAVSALFGDAVAGVITQAVVGGEGPYVFLRCRRGTERELLLALSTVTGCRDMRIALRVLAVSGTLESLRDVIRQKPAQESPAAPETEHCFDKKTVILAQCHGQKVDVIEKGFKNTNRFFLTREDLEKP